MMIKLGMSLSLCAAAFGQLPKERAFEVASVKSAGEPVKGASTSMRGGPGTTEPERITYTKVPLLWVLVKAYGIKDYLIDTPEWVSYEHYDIVANIPPGTSQEDFEQMLRSLLKERFQIVLHHETRPFAAYQLVLDKAGPKIKHPEHQPAATPEVGERIAKRPDDEAFPQLPPGTGPMSKSTVRNGRCRFSARMTTMAGLAGLLEYQIGRPVVDRTGLTGGFDFKLDFSTIGLSGGMNGVRAATASARAAEGLPPLPDDGGPGLFAAIQQQLGLRLESIKAPLDVIVIDHASKVPTAN